MNKYSDIRSILNGILKDGCPNHVFVDDKCLVEQGLDSLAAAKFLLEIGLKFKVSLPFEKLAEGLSLSEIASLIESDAKPDDQGYELKSDHKPEKKRAGSESLPLRPLQQTYLMTSEESYTADPVGCHIYREFDVKDAEVAQVVAAWQRLCDLHPALNSFITMNDRLETGNPVEIRVRQIDEDEFEKRADQQRQKWQCRSNRIADGLVAVCLLATESRARIFLSVDGLIIDGHGMQVLIDQWSPLISNLSTPVPSCDLNSIDCDKILKTPYGEKHRQYWREILSLAPAAPFAGHAKEFLTAKREDRKQKSVIGRKAIRHFLPRSAWQRCIDKARALKISPNSLIFSVFCQVVLEVCKQKSACFIMTTSDRTRLPDSVNHLISSFTSSMIVPVSMQGDDSFEEFSTQLHQAVWQHMGHNSLPAVVALRDAPHGAELGDIFPVVFTSLLGIAKNSNSKHLDAVFASCQTSSVALEHQMWEQDDGLMIHWDVAEEFLPPFAADICFSRLVDRLMTMGAKTRPAPPLTVLQQAYLYERLSKETTDNCTAVFSFILPDLDREKLRQAWAESMATSPTFRSYLDNNCQALVLEDKDLSSHMAVSQINLADMDRARSELDNVLASHRAPMGHWPLQEIYVLKTEEGPASVHLVFDLIFLDAKSIHDTVSGLVQKLTLEGTSRDFKREKSSPVFASMEDGAPEKRASYWSAKMAGLPAGPQTLCQDYTALEWQRCSITLEGYDQLAKVCAQIQMSPDIILATALSVAWMPEMKRPFTIPMVWCHPQEDPLRPSENSQMTWPVITDDLLATQKEDPLSGFSSIVQAFAQETALDLCHGGRYGLQHLSSRYKERGESPFSLPVVYTGLIEWPSLPDFITKSLQWHTRTPGIALDAVSLSIENRLITAWDYLPQAFPEGQIERIFERYCAILKNIMDKPEKFIPKADISMQPPFAGNENQYPIILQEPIHLAFERTAQKYPDQVSLYWQGGSWSFNDLNRTANRIAKKLRDLGIGRESKVALSMKRGPEMVAATLAVLKAGGVYVPIEFSQPQERAERMLRLADVEIILSTSSTPTWPLSDEIKVIAVDRLEESERDGENPDPVNDMQSTAYIIYTSGSTGEPKGVAVDHKALQNLMQWCQGKYQFSPQDIGLCVTSLGFDLSVFDILGLLGFGASLYVTTEQEQCDPALLFDILLDYKITFWNSAPKTFEQLSEYFPHIEGKPEADHLRLAFLSGDYTSLDFPPQLYATFPNIRVVSLGGATEATVWSNFFEVKEIDPGWRSIPYGRPIDNAHYYILDHTKKPCPIGVEGNLFIAGQVLAQGYYNRPELTEERFVSNPFVKRKDAKMYDTGDRAIFLEDGNIMFRGRSDRQVKVRGVRIELEEIEHVIRQHDQVDEAVVLLQKDPSGDVKIVAHVRSEQALHQRDILAFAETKLPRNMMPNHVHIVEKMPITSNGKLDRKALLAPPDHTEKRVNGISKEVLHQAVITEIRQIVQELLGTEIDVDLDLWDQGATSFTMVQLGRRLHSSRGVKLRVEWLLETPTVRGIAHVVYDRMNKEEPINLKEELHESVRIDLLDPEAKAEFLNHGPNLRQDLQDKDYISLPLTKIPPEWLTWRGVHRQFLSQQVSMAAISELLSLVSAQKTSERTRYFYPSAGDTYAVQLYVWIKEGGVEGLKGGYYWFEAGSGRLFKVGYEKTLQRNDQFIYNRKILDQASIALFLVGEMKAIEPLYGDDAEKFLLLEAGYMGQLLLLAQANCGLGICPIGSFKTDAVRAHLDLADSHKILHSFLIGPVDHPQADTGILPPLSVNCSEKTFSSTPDSEVHKKDQGQVAIIGHALRYGTVNSPQEFWQLLSSGQTIVGPSPRREGLDENAKIIGSFLQDITGFDAGFFAIPPSEAKNMDPQARILLEVCGHCLEDAGHTSSSLQQDGERVGVFVGCLWQDYRQVGLEENMAHSSSVTASGSELANRISQCFNFTGPSLAVDTSCASGLTALHLAVSAIEKGDCDSALVCAVNLLSHASHGDVLRSLKMVADHMPDGIYDENTQGWAIGEGAGAVLLRRTTTHSAEADRILAIVEKTHLEHSGGRASFGCPSTESIEAGLHTILQKAGLEPEDIHYVETAASGAVMADAAEWQALSSIFKQGVAIGSVKPNIGHLEAASGLSQLSKVLLQCDHGALAPTRIADNQSSLIDQQNSRLKIINEITPLEFSSAQQRFLINAVGSTGACAQIILTRPKITLIEQEQAVKGPEVLLLSADSKDQLYGLAKDYLARLGCAGQGEWNAICGTAQLSRTSRKMRLAIESSSLEQAIIILENFCQQGPSNGFTLSQAQPQYLDQISQAVNWPDTLQDWLMGYDVGWHRFWSGMPKRIALPPYPYERKRYWLGRDKPHQRPPVMATNPWQEKICEAYSQVSEIPLSELNPSVPLEHYGLNSRLAGDFAALINLQLKQAKLPPTILYEHRDLAAVSRAISALENSEERKNQPSIKPEQHDDPLHKNKKIAITGMAGLFPGAESVEDLWHHLLAGDDLVQGMPENRCFEGAGSELMQGAFLCDIASFDPFLFGITPSDAAHMDPQERILLQLVWQAMEDACYPPGRIKAQLEGNVGVYVGAMHNEYPLLGRDRSTDKTLYDVGGTLAGLANRISYHFDLHGPSLSVDTMCSSSLAALDLAMDALRSGKIKMAIVAACNLSLHPNKFVQQSRLKMTSPDLRCKSFAEDGDGFIPGEGAGVLILRPLQQAEEAHDNIHGVILGSAINHGGKVNGFTVPNSTSQRDLLRLALKDAAIEAESISYIEAHGTGTFLGDPIETSAIIEAMALENAEQKLNIGSIKSNIGHLEGAAGMAGLIKVLLQMRHKILVPSLHASRLNSVIDWRHLNLPVSALPWQPRNQGTREVWRAGVSAFGAGGSNAHVILEAYENKTMDHSIAAPESQILILSAATEEALQASALKYADALSQKYEKPLNLQNVCATLQMGREALAERWAYLVTDLASALQALQDLAAGRACGLRKRARPTDKIITEKLPLDVVADHWVNGAEVDWRIFYSHAPKMLKLPGYHFSKVECWVDDIKDGLALNSLKSNPDRFKACLVEQVWHPVQKEIPVADGSGAELGLILCVVTPASRKLAEQLRSLISGKILIHSIEDNIDYLADKTIGAVLFCADIDHRQESLWQASYAICSLLARKAMVSPFHILQLVSGMHPPATTGMVSNGHILGGLIHNFAAESKGITSTILDIGSLDLADEDSCAICCDSILSELIHPTLGDVCSTRMGWSVPVWQPVPEKTPIWQPDPEAVYIITGGTRGIGARLALELAKKGARKLGLIGRTHSHETDALLEDLRKLQVKVQVHYGAIEQSDAINDWFSKLETTLGPLSGLFHCAGVSSLQKGTLQAMEAKDIQQAMLPKVGGFESLLPMIERYNPEFVIAFSSISAVIGEIGVGVGDYASANLAMEYRASQKHRHGYAMIKTIAWPVWQASGASTTARDLMQHFDLPLLSDEQAFALLWSAITMPGSGRFAVVSPTWDYETYRKNSLLFSKTIESVQEPTSPRKNSGGALEERILAIIANRTGMPVESIHPAMTFSHMGVESILLGQLVEDIEAAIGQPVEPGILLQYPSVEQLVPILREQGVTEAEPGEPDENKISDRHEGNKLHNKVAIIGMAVDFPGASSIHEFSELLREGRCAITEVPEGRWDVATLYDANASPGKSISRWGGFLQDIEDFDPEWFNIDEQSARCLDPAIRLFMEGTENCLRDAGLKTEKLPKNTGVFVGARMGDYHLRCHMQDGDAALGADQNFIAAYIAHHLDIHGPNLVVDSACSSSLTALHLACQSVLSGECDQAFCGGVDVLLDEAVYVQFTRAGALSPSGQCRTFDKDADGFVPGEGAGVFLLKPLDTALKDGNRIHAVIEGSAVNNDGRTMGLTTPNPDAQQEVITTALKNAACNADEIGLIEAHGTATMIGDPLELRALNQAFRVQTERENYCAVGSVKSNIGHLLSAAGIAGLAKAVLAVKENFIPPTLFCDTPNPRFNLKKSPFFIPVETQSWAREKRRIAGVSAFGLGGTNAHVIVGEPPVHSPQVQSLPAAEFNRRRLWLDREIAEISEPEETLSLLDLNFIAVPPETEQINEGERL